MSGPAALLWIALVLPGARAQTVSLREQAQALEEKGRWFEACGLYDELLTKDRNDAVLRDAYRRCLRRFRQSRRLSDESLQTVLNKLTPTKAADLYGEILGKVLSGYAERERADLSTLVQQGLQELRFALDEHGFVQKYLARAGRSGLDGLKNRLARWEDEKVRDLARAKLLLGEIMQAAWQIRIAPGVVALECACGACNSLDEYSLYLAPSRYTQAETARRAKYVGIGIELTIANQKYEIARVYRKGPAALAGLAKGDRVLRIDGQALDPMAPDVVMERLRGEAGTFVELEFLPHGALMAQTIRLERQEVLALSVDYEPWGGYFGYLHIHNFQDSTLQEVKSALDELRAMPMPLQGLIIDLRGNPGGLLKPALGVAELFLPEGVIVHTYGQVRKANQVYLSQNKTPFPLSVPLLVLVDGETASAAEVVAGALKDNRQALLIGQPTYGKGSIQGTIALEKAPGGLRLTVAKFSFSSRVTFNGRGLLPDRVIEDGENDPVRKYAEEILKQSRSMMVQ
ncbi:MAG: PDZ domain-containing protein [Planctomycetes bacterium]|nr:PDZ domain-containing protein [Planctomycetota bacterium]